MGNNTKTYTALGVVLGILLVGGGILFLGQKEKTGEMAQEEAGMKEDPNALPRIEGGTREIIRQEVKTPEPGEVVSQNVATPTLSLEVNEKTGASLRKFEVRAENNAYIPSTIVVNEEDILEIDMLSVDKNYDIFFPDFGVYKKLPKGERVKLEFQAPAFGSYAFFCKEACGGEVKGTLIINKKA